MFKREVTLGEVLGIVLGILTLLGSSYMNTMFKVVSLEIELAALKDDQASIKEELKQLAKELTVEMKSVSINIEQIKIDIAVLKQNQISKYSYGKSTTINDKDDK